MVVVEVAGWDESGDDLAAFAMVRDLALGGDADWRSEYGGDDGVGVTVMRVVEQYEALDGVDGGDAGLLELERKLRKVKGSKERRSGVKIEDIVERVFLVDSRMSSGFKSGVES